MTNKAKALAALLVVGIVAAPLTGAYLYGRQTEARFANAVARLKKVGYPTSSAEYEALEPKRNALAVFRDLAAFDPQFGLASVFGNRDRFHPSLEKAETLPKLDRFFQAVERLDSCDGLRPIAGTGSNSSQAKTWAIILGETALREARKGDQARARQRLAQIETLETILAHSPFSRDAIFGEGVSQIRFETILNAMRASKPADRPWWRKRLAAVLPRDRRWAVSTDAIYVIEMWDPAELYAFNEVERFAFSLDPVKARMRTLDLEVVADMAEALDDGRYTAAESRAGILAAKQRIEGERFLDKSRARALGITAQRIVEEGIHAQHRHALLVGDIILEQLGGPKAAIPAEASVTKAGVDTLVDFSGSRRRWTIGTKAIRLD